MEYGLLQRPMLPLALAVLCSLSPHVLPASLGVAVDEELVMWAYLAVAIVGYLTSSRPDPLPCTALNSVASLCRCVSVCVVCFRFVHYAWTIVNEITAFLGISCLRIPKAKWYKGQ